jgi:multiple sugar transport system permease protein
LSPWQRHYARQAPWLLLPALLLLGVFVVWPLLRGLWWSFHGADLLEPSRQRWLGVSQYSSLLQDQRFRRAFANTALFALLVVPAQTTLALLLALWVNRPSPAWRWLRFAFFSPTVVALPVLSIVWMLLYQPAQGEEMGLVNAVLSAVGVAPRPWLRDPSTALVALAVMSVWQGVGLQMMVFLAGLQTLRREVLEAAVLDGANGWQRLRHVILPGLRNTTAFVITVTTIASFRLFVQPYLMTHGGPEDSTVSVIQLIYETTFISNDLGRSSAAAIVFLIVIAGLTAAQRKLLREEQG